MRMQWSSEHPANPDPRGQTLPIQRQAQKQSQSELCLTPRKQWTEGANLCEFETGSDVPVRRRARGRPFCSPFWMRPPWPWLRAPVALSAAVGRPRPAWGQPAVMKYMNEDMISRQRPDNRQKLPGRTQSHSRPKVNDKDIHTRREGK